MTRVLVLDQAVGLWGAQRYLLRFAPPLAERGIELVLAGPRDLDLAREWRAAGLAHVELPLPVNRSVRRGGDKGPLSPTAMAREARTLQATSSRIAALAVGGGFHLIHANGHAVHLDAALAGRRRRIPVVLHLHEEMPQRFGAMLRAGAVSAATRSVAVSRAVAEGLPSLIRRRVTVIANGVDCTVLTPGAARPQTRRELGAATDEVLVVALTRLDPEKRIEDVIEGLRPLRNAPGWHLAIVGETSSYDAYAAQMHQLGQTVLGDRVTFTGRREDVVEVLRAADVLVHAGVIEGMPLGMLEAQACAVPVVAYAVAGVPEAVIDTKTGILAPAMDAQALGRGVAQLINDPARRQAMGSAGRAHVEAKHSIEGQVDHYAHVVAAMTGRPLRGGVHA